MSYGRNPSMISRKRSHLEEVSSSLQSYYFALNDGGDLSFQAMNDVISVITAQHVIKVTGNVATQDISKRFQARKTVIKKWET